MVMLGTGSAAAQEERQLVPLGITAGIRLETDGLIVTGLSGVNSENGEQYPARNAGVHEGDAIISAGGERVNSIEDLIRAVDKAEGELSLEINREGKKLKLSVRPETESGGKRKIGVLVRDSMLGIGTLTYYDPADEKYGALGHGINDTASGGLLPVRGGRLTGIVLESIVKGEKGAAGELKGRFTEAILGTIEKNTRQGIFGCMEEQPSQKAISICAEGDIKLGSAVLISSVSGELREYDIKIRAIYRGGEGDRDMLLEVTDPELIELTGGIVRGMSGSPVLQDGRLVGAVTHVLVNDSHKGYGISIENMLSACAEIGAAA